MSLNRMLKLAGLKESLTEENDNEEVAAELHEIADQIRELVDHAYSMLPQEGGVRDRARAYWYGHIMSAVGDDMYGSGSATTMLDTVAELQNTEEDEW